MAFISTALVVLVPGTSFAQLDEDELWFDGPSGVQPGQNRERPDVDVDGTGRTVVAWDVGESGQGVDVYTRVFLRNGTALTNPVMANVTTAEDQRYSAVAAAADGSFVVVWVNTFNAGSRGSDVFSIRSRAFDSAGSPVGSEEVVSQQDPSFPGGALFPDIAALAGGGYVVVWRSATFTGSGDTGVSIQGRLLSSSGAPDGNQFQVNTTTTGSQNYPSVDALPSDDPDGPFDGGFVAAWSEPKLHMRRFQADGTTTENDQQVHTTDGEELQLSASESDGHLAVTWQDTSAVWVRLFDANLNALTAAQQVSSVSDTDADDPTITDVGSEGFYIAWNSSTGVGTDNDDRSIQARLLRLDGTFDGTQFQVNKWIQGRQQSPALGSSAGRLGIAWRANDGNPSDGPGDVHILGYLLDYCDLFCDDFESGDTNAWS